MVVDQLSIALLRVRALGRAALTKLFPVRPPRKEDVLQTQMMTAYPDIPRYSGKVSGGRTESSGKNWTYASSLWLKEDRAKGVRES